MTTVRRLRKRCHDIASTTIREVTASKMRFQLSDDDETAAGFDRGDGTALAAAAAAANERCVTMCSG
jgi:hypothetical protein